MFLIFYYYMMLINFILIFIIYYYMKLIIININFHYLLLYEVNKYYINFIIFILLC